MVKHGAKKTPRVWRAGFRPQHVLVRPAAGRIRAIIAMIVIAMLAFVSTVAAATWVDINRAIDSNKVAVIPSKADKGKTDTTVSDSYAGRTITLLVMGQDTRDGDENAAIGGSGADVANNHQADTTMVVQIAADRSWINIVSIPRDSMVDAPSCETTNGTIAARNYVMFNSIFALGYSQGGDLSSAASCTMTAVNSLTGLDIHDFIVVDFGGLKDMIDALGGVDLCIPVDMEDSYTHLQLTKGMQHLDGTSATQYARMRHGTGTDGSDIMRTTRQQYLITQLLNEALSKNLFTQTGQLYQLAKSALNSLNISENLADAAKLVGLAMSLTKLNTSHIYTQTLPVKADPNNSNRVVWADGADEVWAKLIAGDPLTKDTGSDSSNDSQTGTGDGTQDATGDANDSGSQGSDSTSGGDSSSSTPAPTVDPNTGLITEADGTLVDPSTGGIVDPETGNITDPTTGQYIGIADEYLNNVVCAAS